VIFKVKRYYTDPNGKKDSASGEVLATGLAEKKTAPHSESGKRRREKERERNF